MLYSIKPFNPGSPDAVNVCTLTVRMDLCVGCGVCVPVCPTSTLSMGFTDRGDLIPYDSGACRKGCHVCVDACPFLDQKDNEDTLGKSLYGEVPGILHQNEAGFYLGLHVGYAPAVRDESTSGGIGRVLLSHMLDTGYVDTVLSVRDAAEPGKRFEYSVMRSKSDILGSSRSAYYPVEMSEVLTEVIRSDARYAIVGVPCFIKGLRLAMKQNKWLRNRIVFTLGLACGQTKSKFFLEYLVRLLKFDNQQVDHAAFRFKDENHTANNHVFRARIGPEQRQTLFLGSYGEAYNSGQFKLNCCNFCDDVFAEVADATVLDAWLPRYIRDPKGTTILVTRDARVEAMVQTLKTQGALVTTDISIADVVESQMSVIPNKREQIAHRLWMAEKDGKPAPRKRVEAARPSFIQLQVQRAYEELRVCSFEAMQAQQRSGGADLEVYNRMTASALARYKKWQKLQRRVGVYLDAVDRRWKRFRQTGSIGPLPFRRASGA